MQQTYKKTVSRIHNALFLKRIVPSLLLVLLVSWFYGSSELNKLTRHLQMQATRLVHILKNGAATIGTTELQQMSRELENIFNPSTRSDHAPKV